MALDALATIQQFESSNRNVQQQLVPTSVSTASGYYQITNSTWNGTIAPAIGLPKVGPGTANPDGVMDLSPAQQEQGAAYLFATQGFGPWTCTGCNAKLAQYVASQGGEAAFSLTSAEQASLTGTDQTDTGTSTDQTSTSTGTNQTNTGDISFTAADPATAGSGSGTALPAVSSQASVLSSPFTWAYKELITSTQQAATTDITNLQTAVGTYSPLLLTLALVALGIRALFGQFIVDRYARFVLKACWVMPFIAVGSSLYQTYVVNPVMGLPSWWQGYLTNSSGYQLTGASPAALFDWVYAATYSTEAQIWAATPWSFHAIAIAIALFAARLIIVLSLGALFIAYAMLTMLALVMLIIGPVCIPFALFAETTFLFRGWVWATATLVLSMLAIDVLLSLFMAVMTALMQALTVTGTPQTDVPSFWGAAIVMGILGWSVRYVPRVIERIGSGVSVGLDYAAYHMSGGPVRAAAMRLASAPSTMARRFTGI